MHIEQLDPRRLCSVSVAQTYPGFWEIHGDDSANRIVVTVNLDEGTFSFGGTTYGNGALEQLSIYGYGGDDYISVNASGDPSWIAASIHAGDGDDSVYVNNLAAAVWGG